MGRKRIDCGPPVELSNPRVLQNIAQRCAVCEECGKRTHWLGAKNQQDVYPLRVNQRCYSVRRVVFELNGGTLKQNSKIITTCANHRCIDPAQLKQVTMKHIVREALREGKLFTPASRAKIAATQRANKGKITQEAAEQIRLDTRPSTVIAAENGISDSYVRAIRQGTARKTYGGGNPFAGLGAR